MSHFQFKKAKIVSAQGGPQSTMDSVVASHPVAPVLIPGVPKNFSEFLMLLRLIDGAAA